MTMHAPDTRTLTVLLEREEAARDAVALALRTAETHLAQAQAQAEALAAYRRDYLARWSAQLQQSAAIEVVHCYRSFMQRLDQALEQQTGVIRRAESTVAQRRAERLAAETRCAAIARLIGRRVEAHRHHEQRLEQRRTDEAAQRSAFARRAGLPGLAH